MTCVTLKRMDYDALKVMCKRIFATEKERIPPVGWRYVEAEVLIPISSISPELYCRGMRDKDPEGSAIFYTQGILEADLCNKIPYLEMMVANTYISLLTFTDCDCKPDPKRPFATQYCAKHKEMYEPEEEDAPH